MPKTNKAEIPSRSVVVSLIPNGTITVEDFSHQEDRLELANRLREMGVTTEVVFDSPCG